MAKPAKIKNLETDNHVFFVGVPFSQWHVCKFKDESGREFNSAEQYMMFHKAMLFGDKEIADKIMEAKTPEEQKTLGRQVKNFDVEIWAEHARDIVYEASRLKYSQNPGLWYVLAQTGKKPLVEAADYDPIWGVGLAAGDPAILDKANWKGKNWLGETLTKLRDEFFRQRVPVPAPQQVSPEEREYAYAFIAMKVPGTNNFTTLKAIADHAKISVSNVLDSLQNTHPRDGDFDTFEAPINDNNKIATINVNAFMSANREPLAYAEIVRKVEEFDDIPPALIKTPRLGL